MASPQSDSDGQSVNVSRSSSPTTKEQDLDYSNALTALAAAERKAQQDPEHNPPVRMDDPNWKTVYARLTQLSADDPERAAEEAMKVRGVVAPDSPLANAAHQIFRDSIATLEDRGQNVTAMSLLGKDIAPGQDKELSGRLKSEISIPSGSESDHSGIAALARYNEWSGMTAPGKLSPDASATDANLRMPSQAYPLTENEQGADTGEYVKLASLNAESQQNLMAITHSLAGVLSSNADSTKDPGKTGAMWELLRNDATTIYQQDAIAPGLSDAQSTQIQNDKNQMTHDLEALIAALRRDEQRNADNPDRMAFNESQIQMVKIIANDSGNVVLKDGNGSLAQDGGTKGFPVQDHDPSQPIPPPNVTIARQERSQSSPDLP